MAAANDAVDGLPAAAGEEPLRILILSYEFPPLGGGGGKVVRGLTQGLVEQGHAVDVVTTRFADAAAAEEIDGVAVWRVKALRRRLDRSNVLELAAYVLPSLLQARRLMASHAYDVCHAHFILPDGLVAGLLRLLTGQRYLITAHGSDVPGYNPDRFGLAHRLLRPLWQRVVAGAQTVVCPSPSLRDLLRSHQAAVATTVIPNGFDPRRFAPVGNDGARPGVLFVSRLLERKGLQHLLAALAASGTGARLDVVGDGPYRGELERRAAGLPVEVVFHGWLDNDSPALAELYRSRGIFVLPSSSENFPVCLLEAMSAGMAIVTTAGTGCADVVGDAGLLVPYGDVAALQAALARLLANADERAQLGARARQRLLDRFAWPTVVRQHLALYRRCRALPSVAQREGRKAAALRD